MINEIGPGSYRRWDDVGMMSREIQINYLGIARLHDDKDMCDDAGDRRLEICIDPYLES